MEYDLTVGLEVHLQLNTNTKAFSSDVNRYGDSPNSNISPVSLGHPGTLPQLNENSVQFAIMLGLACGSKITEFNKFSRKNYFYADLPKGYQITQYDTPICTGGEILLELEGISEKTVRISHIQIEEDSGKSIHDQDPYFTLIDLNRAGVPLLEIVSMPDITSGEEAYAYLMKIRKLVRHLGISDGNMEEGSLRCDANISIKPRGTKKLGQKVEVKNMNSMRNVRKAIEFEAKRQQQLLEQGGKIDHETRTFDATTGTTFGMRSKEESNDYRYFTEPDLTPVLVDSDMIQSIQKQIPLLPDEIHRIMTKEHGLSTYDASVIGESRANSEFYFDIVKSISDYKAVANWLMGPVRSYLNQNAISIKDLPLNAGQIAAILKLIKDGKVSHSAASGKLWEYLLDNPDNVPEEAATKLDLIQQSSAQDLENIILEALQENPEENDRLANGDMKLVGFFMGQIMKKTRGKADPNISRKILLKLTQND
ncbi:MAG TPA: Asp-tRNA(Asn)/Glu-tRNA(Gln) amidotransferase GatCAB subunit B [Flavobacteriales bacterium]|nr:Asp-tRNA(Asn)/Glu-tRNA(Gln) amidotransferase GatCAB subunit B [Flavobacteriales bacterium]